MPNISHILRDNMVSPEDKIRLLVLYAYQKGGISKGSQSVRFRIPTVKLKIPGKLFLNPNLELLLRPKYSF